MRIAALLFVLPAFAGPAATVIYDGKATAVEEKLQDPGNLWLTLPQLTTASGFVLKPQGACLNELCVPIPKASGKAYVRKVEAVTYFNLSQLARTLHEPAVHDSANEIWLFGARPESQMKYVNTLEAPDFTLTDWKGVSRSLSDLRGKKVMLITWASW